MIVKNEEAFLEQCLQSVQGLVDEIIIVDTGSTDKTKKIALRFTSKVYDFKWCDDFAAARNESLKYATGDWILVLDADEVISKEDFAVIKELISDNFIYGYSLTQRSYTNNSSREGFNIRSQDNYSEGEGYLGWTESKIVRLFRNKKDILFKGAVHELVEDSLRDSNLKVFPINLPIHHFRESKGVEVQNKKSSLYRELGLKKVGSNPNDHCGHLELALSYRVKKDYEKALSHLQKALEIKVDFPEARCELGLLYNDLKQFEKAQECFDWCVHFFPNYAEPYFGAGVVLVNLGRLDEAENVILRGLEITPRNIHARINLGAIYERKGDFSKAKMVLVDVLKVDSRSARGYHNLGVVQEKLGKLNLALNCYQRALELGYKKEGLLERVDKIKTFLAENHG